VRKANHAERLGRKAAGLNHFQPGNDTAAGLPLFSPFPASHLKKRILVQDRGEGKI
jgi:hypothetical protein